MGGGGGGEGRGVVEGGVVGGAWGGVVGDGGSLGSWWGRGETARVTGVSQRCVEGAAWGGVAAVGVGEPGRAGRECADATRTAEPPPGPPPPPAGTRELAFDGAPQPPVSAEQREDREDPVWCVGYVLCSGVQRVLQRCRVFDWLLCAPCAGLCWVFPGRGRRFSPQTVGAFVAPRVLSGSPGHGGMYVYEIGASCQRERRGDDRLGEARWQHWLMRTTLVALETRRTPAPLGPRTHMCFRCSDAAPTVVSGAGLRKLSTRI